MTGDESITRLGNPKVREGTYAIRDDVPLSEPGENKVLSGQLEPGLVTEAAPNEVKLGEIV